MTHTRKINYLIWKKTKYPTFFFYRIWRRKKPAKKCSQNWVKGKPFDAEIPPPTNILLEYIYYRTSPFFLSFPTFFPLPPSSSSTAAAVQSIDQLSKDKFTMKLCILVVKIKQNPNPLSSRKSKFGSKTIFFSKSWQRKHAFKKSRFAHAGHFDVKS
jgi:hypothetical protein